MIGGRTLGDLDERVDHWWGRWRDRPLIDRIMFAATNAGEFSMIWHGIGIGRALTGRWSWRRAVRFSIVMGLESLIVNQGIKRLVRRTRPSTAADNTSSHHLRQPVTSSFPSGHSSAAWCAVTVLRPPGTKVGALPLLGTVVATSRIHVRLHHASDVVAGTIVGWALGLLARRFVWGRRS